MKNKKSTFSVLFYLKKDKMKKNGLVSMEIQRLNSMLDDIKANIRSHFHNQLMRDSYVTPESVKNALLGKEEEALYNYQYNSLKKTPNPASYAYL